MTKNLTLPQLLCEQAEKLDATCVAIREKAYGIWETWNWRDYQRYMEQTALGLHALGFKRGQTAALILDNHAEWLFSQLAVQAMGGVPVNLFTSATPEELVTLLGRLRSPYAFVQDQEQTDKILDSRTKLPFIKKVVYVDPTGMHGYEGNPFLISFRDLLKVGEETGRKNPELFGKELKKGRSDDTAVMMLTSGTTGIPKLAMLSHRNFLAMGRQWTEALHMNHGDNWLSMAPPAWIVDQMWGFGIALCSGMTMNFPELPETVLSDFREVGPSVMITSSRFWEDLASRIRVRMSDAGWVKRRFYDWSVDVGKRVVETQAAKKTPSPMLHFVHKIANHLIFRPLLDRVGCACFRAAYTGGHPISPDVILFFRSIGLNLKQCYGLTEACGIFQVQPDGEVKLETVGKPLPETAIQIAEDQEILVKSEANFVGYYQDYEATENAFTDGWLKTGDAGYIDPDGHLLIIGRKEEIIRNKQGDAFSPDFIETRLKFSPYIKEAVVFGEGKGFIAAMINIDQDNVANWAEQQKIPFTTYMDLSQQPAVEQLVLRDITKVNEQLPPYMKIRKFFLLYKLLDADDEELTRTGKVRRRFVYGLYLKLIEGMYEGKKEIAVKGKVKYRDGQVGQIETTVRVIDVIVPEIEKKGSYPAPGKTVVEATF
ncbi:MAG: long-chain fatty acid--CoA ligase [Deltaproteobacteria bacterium]|nr:long-chain fatty acid--CoA ligase [Deltaproteobacteria bacterium]